MKATFKILFFLTYNFASHFAFSQSDVVSIVKHYYEDSIVEFYHVEKCGLANNGEHSICIKRYNLKKDEIV